ncbi:MAG: hypothetical protein US49_C0001G0155 [candidate division TM6 bacterium GW2011_GWF2_37_49]|nr:MAG: hypothetical protein US49_C0001G0155 [candidate division TM6 bacterium GW2011_GWF2_37_49]
MLRKSSIFILLFFVLPHIIFSACTKSSGKHASKVQLEKFVHMANLSSDWYPQQSESLEKELNAYFEQAKRDFNIVVDGDKIKALIVPHAGYYYSGLCSACAYRALLDKNGDKNKHISRVIVLCPSHRVFLNNIALPDYNVYQTCLGQLDVDTQAINILGKSSSVFRTHADAHNIEHAIEVQLPFLQKTINNFKIVPLIVGHLTQDSFHEAAMAIKKIVNDATLVVVSSDFTHFGKTYEYLPFSKLVFHQVRYLDSLAIQAITGLSGYGFEQFLHDTHATICGQMPINVLLGLSSLGVYKSLNSRLACYYNSAQLKKAINGNVINSDILLNPVSDLECEGCVSYASIIFTEHAVGELSREDVLSDYDKKSLLKLARQVIVNAFRLDIDKIPEHLIYPVITPTIQLASGAFVTLNTKNGDLRGCIGQIWANKPLYQIVAEMALASAFNDSRFSPLKKEELDNIVIDITILTVPRKVGNYKEIQIGRDGVILNKIDASGQVKATAVFLPQVPGQFGWNLATTLEHLSQKAGLGKNDWQHDCEFEVFEGFEIREK